MARWLRSSFVVVALMVTALSGEPAFADSKVDLTEHLMPQPLPGDFKNFAFSDDASRVLDVLSVVPWKKNGWQAVLSQQDEGLEASTVTQFVVPGRKALIGELAAGTIAVDFDKPKRLFKLRVVPGNLNRFQMSGTAFIAGDPVGPGTYRGTWQFLGFEDVTTPTVTWPMAARVQVAGALRIKFRANGNIMEALLNRTAWLAEGIGEVASDEGAVRVYLNGVLQNETPARTGWLESGVWRGMPIP